MEEKHHEKHKHFWKINNKTRKYNVHRFGHDVYFDFAVVSSVLHCKQRKTEYSHGV